MEKQADISECKHYRYVLTRKWAEGPCVTFVMLNPSTADAEVDDPTIRRCIGFAQREGFGMLAVVNLTPYRAANPRDLQTAEAPLLCARGATYTRLMAERSGKVIVAWGSWGDRFGGLVSRNLEVLDGVDLWCLGTVKSGQPRHPLYLAKTAPLFRWVPGQLA